MKVTTRHLSPLATELTGVPVTVRIGVDLPYDVHGLASHDGRTYVIHISSKVFEYQNVKELGRVFRHECGHIAHRHIAATGRWTPAEIDAAASVPDVGGVPYPTAAARRMEDEAEAWGEAHRTQAPDGMIWRLVTQAG